MIVCKFGGTSVGDAAAITRAARIIADRREQQPIVVVSALGGVTNALIQIAERAAAGLEVQTAVDTLRARHEAQTHLLLRDDPSADEETARVVNELFIRLESLAEALHTLGDLTPRSLDTITALGEQLSSVIVVAAFKRLGVPAELVDARQIMITDSQFTRAEPQADAIAEASERILRPLVEAGKVPVLGGYIGSARGTGITTTLGRGGSDYSASLIGSALGVKAIEIWTDVDGILTADPRVVQGAQLIERIGFDEASELASFGAKVLHPNTIAPAVTRGIPVYVLNAARPEGAGTLIMFEPPSRAVTAIAGKSGVTLVKVHSPRMVLTEGFMRRIFEAFEHHRTSVDVVATSEVSVSVTIDDTSHLDALVVDLEKFATVNRDPDCGIVSIVGNGLSEGGSAMSRALAVLADVRVHMVSLSSSGINFTIVLDGKEVTPAIQLLHQAFFSDAA